MSDLTPFAAESNALPPGTRLGEFELLKVLGHGGFSIVYLAMDQSLQREVAIKEYMPESLAARFSATIVGPRTEASREVFERGRTHFIREAQLLARYDHPNLIRVYRFWEANGTAYMTMPVYRGETLHRQRRAYSDRAANEDSLRALLVALLNVLRLLHSDGVIHRDISPDNIVIEPDGRPVLLDFGAARQLLAGGGATQDLTTILKPSYAPIEQYGDMDGIKQGPWTDLYALGATLHFLLVGKPPPSSITRVLNDDYVPLEKRGIPGFSPKFLRVIDALLELKPNSRPRSAAEVLGVLGEDTALRARPSQFSPIKPTLRLQLPPLSSVFDAISQFFSWLLKKLSPRLPDDSARERVASGAAPPPGPPIPPPPSQQSPEPEPPTPPEPLDSSDPKADTL